MGKKRASDEAETRTDRRKMADFYPTQQNRTARTWIHRNKQTQYAFESA